MFVEKYESLDEKLGKLPSLGLWALLQNRHCEERVNLLQESALYACTRFTHETSRHAEDLKKDDDGATEIISCLFSAINDFHLLPHLAQCRNGGWETKRGADNAYNAALEAASRSVAETAIRLYTAIPSHALGCVQGQSRDKPGEHCPALVRTRALLVNVVAHAWNTISHEDVAVQLFMFLIDKSDAAPFSEYSKAITDAVRQNNERCPLTRIEQMLIILWHAMATRTSSPHHSGLRDLFNVLSMGWMKRLRESMFTVAHLAKIRLTLDPGSCVSTLYHLDAQRHSECAWKQVADYAAHIGILNLTALSLIKYFNEDWAVESLKIDEGGEKAIVSISVSRKEKADEIRDLIKTKAPQWHSPHPDVSVWAVIKHEGSIIRMLEITGSPTTVADR